MPSEFDPHLLSVEERCILWFCQECRTRTQIVRKTRNHPPGKRNTILNRLKKLALLDSFEEEIHEDPRRRRPTEHFVLTPKGERCIKQFKKWVIDMKKQSFKEGAQ